MSDDADWSGEANDMSAGSPNRTIREPTGKSSG